jgi:hypothetical protein
VVANGAPDEVARAVQILERTNAHSVHLHTANSDDAVEIDDLPKRDLPAGHQG